MFGAEKKSLRCHSCAIDQDPCFRMTRDAARIGGYKPALVESRFSPLRAVGQDVRQHPPAPSTSPTPEEIKDKVNKYAFSAGEYRGGTPRRGWRPRRRHLVEVAQLFMDDDERLAEIGRESAPTDAERRDQGLIECLTPMIVAQEARAKVSDAHVDQFFSTASRVASMFENSGTRSHGRVVSFRIGNLVATGAPGPAEVGKGGDGEGGGGGADGQPPRRRAQVAEGEGVAEEGEEGGGEGGGAGTEHGTERTSLGVL